MLKAVFKKTPIYYLVASSGWGSRVIVAVVQLISIPIILRFLGVRNYAVFAILTGLVGWFNSLDLGIGASVQNHISRLRANNGDCQVFLQSIALCFLLVAGLEVFFFSLIAPYLQSLLLSKFPLKPGYWFLFGVIGDLYILSVVFGISYKIFFAQQRGYWGYVYQTIGYLLALCLVMLIPLIFLHDRLVWMLLAWVSPQALMAIVGFIHVLPLTAWWKSLSFSLFKKILSMAWQFGFFTLSAALVLGVDYVIMAQFLRASDIVVYSIFNKVFFFVYFGYSAILSALWPVMSEAFASGEKKRLLSINSMMLRNLMIAVIFILVGTVAILFSKHLILKLFAKKELVVSWLVIVLFGFYYIVRVWTDTYAMILQSRGRMKVFLLAVPLQGVLSVVLMSMLSHYLGLFGVLLALIFSFILTVTWILPVAHYRLLKKGR